MQYLEIKEIHTHNLKGFKLKIPLNSLVVITGPSGSGKSSLAIHTIAEEGKNRLYQILNYSQEGYFTEGSKAKFISPLPPIIAMNQGIKNWHPYKTVGEFFSLYQILRLLFEEYGEYKCPGCGEFNKVSSLNRVIKWFQSLKEGEKFYFLLPLPENTPKALEFLVSQGYVKYIIDEKEVDLSEEKIPEKFNKIYLLLDRMIKEKGSLERFVDNLRISLGLNQGRVILRFLSGKEYFFNLKSVCLKCGTPLLTVWVKCKTCKGYGYKEREICKDCKGLKIEPLILESKLLGKSLKEWLNMSVRDFYESLKNLEISEDLKSWLDSILFKLEKALFLEIDYLKLSTPVFNLSVGEKKLLEILLIFSVNLNKVLFILDEPTVGLDIEKKKKLLVLLRELINNENSVILVEHDPFIIQNADYIIELGKEGGEKGGYLIKADFRENFFNNGNSLVCEYLKGKRKIKNFLFSPKRKEFIELDIKEKLVLLKGGINLIYGKTGSKKTEIFNKIFSILEEKENKVLRVETKSLEKKNDFIISYIGIWDDLREILIKLPSARLKGLTKRNFSFYTKEGICPVCEGKGEKILETENLKLSYPCEECLGKRLNPEVLNLTYKGFKISEIFDLTIDELLPIIGNISEIKEKVLLLKSLNLSYLRLGQVVKELSGGEKSRLFMGKKLLDKTKFDFLLLEYPLQGLFLEDIKYLVNWLSLLRKENITVVILDANPLALFLSDWLIEVEKGEVKFAGFTQSWLEKFDSESLIYQKFFDLVKID